MASIPHLRPRTVEEVFNNFKGRRAGLVKALTDDFSLFSQQCDPEKENLCLFGHPNETWELKPPVAPPVLPEPVVGINFARDGMKEKDWLSFVAFNCDSWLLCVAFYYGAKFGFGKSDRSRLFHMINNYPTVHEVVKETSRQSERVPTGAMMYVPKDEDKSEEEEKQGTTSCKACGINYVSSMDEFWICCDICEGWFHGKCVKITPTQAERIKQYKCPACCA